LICPYLKLPGNIQLVIATLSFVCPRAFQNPYIAQDQIPKQDPKTARFVAVVQSFEHNSFLTSASAWPSIVLDTMNLSLVLAKNANI
jgi:ATP/ADP translocase